MRTSKKVFGIGLMLLIFGNQAFIWAQVNVSGKAGLIYIPSAELQQDGAFSFGYNYNPSNYAIKFNKRNSESIYFINLALLPRFEVNINLLRPNGTIPFNEGGIGDRQVDLKYVFATEKEKWPSMAVIMSAPFGVDNSLITYALVGTKHVAITKLVTAAFTVGISSPYYFGRTGNTNDVLADFTIRDKRDLPYRYLSGPFGGINLNVAKKGGLMLEWDSQHLNVGAYAFLFKHWTLQAGLLNGDQLTFGTSYTLNVFRLPKRVAANHGES